MIRICNGAASLARQLLCFTTRLKMSRETHENGKMSELYLHLHSWKSEINCAQRQLVPPARLRWTIGYSGAQFWVQFRRDTGVAVMGPNDEKWSVRALRALLVIPKTQEFLFWRDCVQLYVKSVSVTTVIMRLWQWMAKWCSEQATLGISCMVYVLYDL